MDASEKWMIIWFTLYKPPPPSENGFSCKKFLEIFLAAKWRVWHSSTSATQNSSDDLCLLLSVSSSMEYALPPAIQPASSLSLECNISKNFVTAAHSQNLQFQCRGHDITYTPYLGKVGEKITKIIKHWDSVAEPVEAELFEILSRSRNYLFLINIYCSQFEGCQEEEEEKSIATYF